MTRQPIDLMKLIHQEKNARMRLRLLALQHFLEGKSRYQIAAYLKVSRTSVNTWISNYLSHGLAGLMEKRRPGRPSALSQAQLQQLLLHIERRRNGDGTEMSGLEIQSYIATTFGVDYEISNIYRILDRILPS
ncbi:helix-turn-helix domain-containing protein [Shewanella cyperi]|uniref:helix-turn-helix domain-containing protein n=1 Tax=Shewanella cyperi TaxID=2814292 RepID=UPI001A9428FE|nr:helix-turn-helix domain-containing protein [Shewanella cyperi]QSX40433.1 helix-turn-helix domain-containing protein [Shewanella cyperi]